MSRPPADDWSDGWQHDQEHESHERRRAHPDDEPFDHTDLDDDVLGGGYGEDAVGRGRHDYDDHDDHGYSDDEDRHDHPTRADRRVRRDERTRHGERRRRPFLALVAVVAALAVVAGAGYVALRALDINLPSLSLPGLDGGAPDDFAGPGSGEVVVQIPQGAGGDQIGGILADSNVVASREAFAAVAAANPAARAIQPGTYRMAREMSAAGALDRLLDPAYRSDVQVTFPEGLWKEEVFSRLADATQYEVADYEAVEIADLDLPESAGGDMEGYLFPQTYSFGPDETPEENLQKMIDMGVQRHAALGLTDSAESERTLIIASIIQAEVNQPDDLPRVARVIENRLADDGRLEMDSTIHFIFKERGRAGTSNEQRASDSPYNTYQVTGLPPGPINSPGDDAIRAALEPAEGDWRFFVTVDPDSGETVFSETFGEHEEAVEDFQAWCRENTDRC